MSAVLNVGREQRALVTRYRDEVRDVLTRRVEAVVLSALLALQAYWNGALYVDARGNSMLGSLAILWTSAIPSAVYLAGAILFIAVLHTRPRGLLLVGLGAAVALWNGLVFALESRI